MSDILNLNETGTGSEENLPVGKVLLRMEDRHIAVSEQLAEYAGQRKSFLRRLFPTRLDVVLQDAELNAARTHSDFNNRLLTLACAMKVEACREAADTWVKSLKVHNRQRFYDFVTAKLNELSKTIESHRVEFALHMRAREANAKQFADMPSLQKRYEESVEIEMQETMLWLDGLLRQFRGIMQERVNQFDRTALPAK